MVCANQALAWLRSQDRRRHYPFPAESRRQTETPICAATTTRRPTPPTPHPSLSSLLSLSLFAAGAVDGKTLDLSPS